MWSGSKQPALIGTSGKMCLMARYTAALVVAMTLFSGPRHGGLDSEKSKCRSLPAFRRRSRIASGSGPMPSESRNASPVYTPSGILAMCARIICSERSRSSVTHAVTVSSP